MKLKKTILSVCLTLSLMGSAGYGYGLVNPATQLSEQICFTFPFSGKKICFPTPGGGSGGSSSSSSCSTSLSGGTCTVKKCTNGNCTTETFTPTAERPCACRN